MRSTTMKAILVMVLALNFSQIGYSQTITAADKKKLQAKQDTLQEYARYLITDSLTEDRMVSDSVFTRTLVRALQIKNSFYYPLIQYLVFQNYMLPTVRSGFSPGLSSLMIFIQDNGEPYNFGQKMAR